MDEKREKINKSKIIPYPGLVRRLIEKGMESLKEKEPREAYELFNEAANYEPDHPQVRFGRVLCLVELGRLEEAVEQTTSLLHEDIGDYYDNLQVHISLLVQLARYHEVVHLLDAVLAENRLPSQHAESLYQLLHFSRQMTNDDSFTTFTEREDEVNEHVLSMLQSDNVSLQGQAIQILKTMNKPYVIEAFISYVQEEQHDLLLRSIALEALHNFDVSESIHIKKLGMNQTVIPNQLPLVYEQPFAKEVIQLLSDFLEHENPNLLEMANQLCWAHMYAIYPFSPEPKQAELWATVFYIVVSNRMGMDINEEWVESISNKDILQLDEYVQLVEVIEMKSYQGFDLNGFHL
ncbi:hypothetical protein AJ85_09330 [Alkalihalobacillus alcalophilus ATCC 27647 = CGMCC 1.3604]|uniref:Hydrolase n=1 Tax=Alkalihalobacillus alcalophilus ATCC 27647 = CGMCC 1.3604 TaxID=1218173 RepID=A0A094XH28_ALKAL|nr:tetratricopeptide repeat protein [Alkalihalobacillus alcalophilus]KGA98100.1 hypothetical protein BALCAV_0206110 [Alkalihalobacillus alcalophilus ATCC 27647 = CGMCC 1.3604]MED1561437.1 tetratricopeptide repeat protein [Alkalihalobacillus alcalophilus]THG90711.1 hypothetical protein AJ85_09330 [Alkalihalobacillus alcalophilus ATCC 27647 = CGMCC 1.3604]